MQTPSNPYSFDEYTTAESREELRQRFLAAAAQYGSTGEQLEAAFESIFASASNAFEMLMKEFDRLWYDAVETLRTLWIQRVASPTCDDIPLKDEFEFHHRRLSRICIRSPT